MTKQTRVKFLVAGFTLPLLLRYNQQNNHCLRLCLGGPTVAISDQKDILEKWILIDELVKEDKVRKRKKRQGKQLSK